MHHRDTENTKVAQRKRETATLPKFQELRCLLMCCSKLCVPLGCVFDDKESSFATTGGDVDHRRIGQTHHNALDASTKEKWIGVNEHWLQAPAALVKDRKDLCLEFDLFLRYIVALERP